MCSTQARLMQEVNNIVEVFRKNEYPEWLIANERKKFMSENRNVTTSSEDSEKDFKCILVFPYIGKESVKLAKRIKRIFSDTFIRADVMVAYRNHKIGSYFGLKDKTPDLFSTNLVYEFRCSEDRDGSYIGTTTRHLWKRLQEHMDPKKESAIQSHLADCPKCCEVPDLSHLVKVRKRCTTPREAEIAESILITNERPILNKQLGTAQGRPYVLNVFK